jgi:adenosylmethionine-8-amino-7-oxononanoate aminotransferase
MATTSSSLTSEQLQELANKHLWLHFSRMGSYQRGEEIPIIVRGDGC